ARDREPMTGSAPVVRPRRLRAASTVRDLVAETDVLPRHLMMPFFVVPGRGQEQPIASLPGVSRLSPDVLLPRLERALELGIRSTVLFGVVPAADKDPLGLAAHDPSGPVAEAVQAAKRAFGDDLTVITDVCLCGYTDHGHCGVLATTSRGVVVDNDASLRHLAAMALAHAEAGADIVSPSDMMDGRVAALRTALDHGGFADVGILSYAVKYASAFYGPFREAAGSSPSGTSGAPAATGGTPTGSPGAPANANGAASSAGDPRADTHTAPPRD